MKPLLSEYRSLRILLLAILLATASACQTNETKAYNKLKPGMDKDDVLDTMGDPRRTHRSHGQDRWQYVYYENSQKVTKEVKFEEGNAIYVGEVPKPAVSAEEQDRRNEISNREMEQNYQKYDINQFKCRFFHIFDRINVN